MQIDFKIQTHNTRIINFDVILRDSFKKLNEDCVLYSLPIDIVSNNDCCKLFKNAVIVTLCNRIKSISLMDKKIIYVNTNSNFIPLHVTDFTLKIVYQILDNMSIAYIINNESFSLFCDQLSNRNNDKLYLFNTAYNTITGNSKLPTTYKKLMAYLKANGLMFLYNAYFRGSTNKLIVLS